MTFFWAILFGDLSLHCLCQKCSHPFITGAGFVLDPKLHWTMWGSRFACTSMKQWFLFVAFSNEREFFFISVTYSAHNFGDFWTFYIYTTLFDLWMIKSLIKTNVAGMPSSWKPDAQDIEKVSNPEIIHQCAKTTQNTLATP